MYLDNYIDRVDLAAIKRKLYEEISKNQKRSVIFIIAAIILLGLLIGLIGGADEGKYMN